MKISTLFILSILISTSVSAYDDLISGAQTGVLSQNTGVVLGAPSLAYLTAEDKFNADGDKKSLSDNTVNFRLPLLTRYRFKENIEAFAMFPVVSMDKDGISEFGLGDIWLGAKYSVIPDGLLSVRGAVNLGNGDDAKGLGNTGGFGLDLGAISNRWIVEDKVKTIAQAGMRWMGEDSDTKVQPGFGTYATGDVYCKIVDKTWFHSGIEFMYNGDNKLDGKDANDSGMTNLDLNIGLGREIRSILLNGSFIYTVTGKNSLANTGFRLSFDYTF